LNAIFGAFLVAKWLKCTENQRATPEEAAAEC